MKSLRKSNKGKEGERQCCMCVVLAESRKEKQRVFLVKDNCVSNGPLVRSLAPLTPLICRQCSALLHSLALFRGSLTHYTHSLVEKLKITNMCSHCKRVQREQTRFSSSLETRPESKRETEDDEVSLAFLLD